MIVHPKPEPASQPVFLVGSDGSRRRFVSLTDLASKLGRHFIYHCLVDRVEPQPPVGVTLYTVCTQDGEPVTPARVLAHLPATVSCWQRPAQPEHLWRRAPVSHTGRFRRYISCRHPRTFSLIREAYWREADTPSVRARLRASPTAWDDLLRSDRSNRSWKRHRRHQWRP